MAAVRVCAASDVPTPGALQVMVDAPGGRQVPVAVVRDSAGDLHAIGDTCTHQQVSLSEGEVEGTGIECWLHGSLFDLRTGAPDGLPAITPVPVYALSTDGDDVLVDVATTPDAARGAAPATEPSRAS